MNPFDFGEIRADESSALPRFTNRREPMLNMTSIDWESRASKLKGGRSRTIQKVAVVDSLIMLAMHPCSILRWRLNQQNRDAEEIEIVSKADDAIDRLFLDPSGMHALIGMRSGDVHYLHGRSLKAKKLSKLNGNLESVAFDGVSQLAGSNATEASTRSMLLGTSTGYIYEVVVDSTGKEKVWQVVHTLDTAIPISALLYESFTQPPDTEARTLVLFATASPTRLYHICGGAGESLQQVFEPYQRKGGSSGLDVPFAELPGDLPRAELLMYPSNNPLKNKTFALLTAAGIYHGPVSSLLSSSSSHASLEAHILPFPHAPRDVEPFVPLSFSVSDFHFLILGGRRLLVVSMLNGDLIEEDKLAEAEGVPLAIAQDLSKGKNVVYCTGSVQPVTLHQEDRNIWRVYLEKAVATGQQTMFDSALLYAKTAEQKRTISRIRAEFALLQGDLETAAWHFAKSGLSFEDVVLRLVKDLPLSPSSSSVPLLPPSLVAQMSALPSSSVTVTVTSGQPMPTLAQLLGRDPNTLTAGSLTGALASAAGGASGAGSASSGSNASSSAAVSAQDAAAEIAQWTPLRIYAQELLKDLPSTWRSQRTMLVTWVCELHLHQLSVLDLQVDTASNSNTTNSSGSSSWNVQREELKQSLLRTLREHRLVVNVDTLVSLLVARNQRVLLLALSKVMGDYHRVVSLLMTEGRVVEALDVLGEAPTEKVELFLYKILPVLMETQPEKTVSMLVRKTHLSFSALLPTLLHYHNLRVSAAPGGANHALAYLEVCLSQCGISLTATDPAADAEDPDVGLNLDLWTGSTLEPLFLHTLFWMLVQEESRSLFPGNSSSNSSNNSKPPASKALVLLARLVRLQELGLLDEIVMVDKEYLLRICKLPTLQTSSSSSSSSPSMKTPTAVLRWSQRLVTHALWLLQQHRAAVEVAVQVDAQWAKQWAKRLTVVLSAPPVALLRALWMVIARHAVQQHAQAVVDVHTCVALIRESEGVLQIEDLLDLLPDFTEIDVLREDISLSLQHSADRIVAVKEDMGRLASSVDSTLQELERIKHRGYSMGSVHQTCEHCHDSLWQSGSAFSSAAQQSSFYLFPCSHGFHGSCLLQLVKPTLTSAQRQTLEQVLEGLQRFGGGQGNSGALFSQSAAYSSDPRVRAQVEALHGNLDQLLGADCPLCGTSVVHALSTPLITAEMVQSGEVQSWQLD